MGRLIAEKLHFPRGWY